MVSNQDGVFVPRRVIFTMIFVSICINIFFLLLGILIGKDDLKWLKQGETPAELNETTAMEAAPENDLGMELSVFEGETEKDRPDPVDVSYLDERQEPAPPEEKPVATPTERPKDPPLTSSPKAVESGGYWVQILAVKDRSKARRRAQEAERKGYGHSIVEENGYFKVRLGPFPDRETALRKKAEIDKELKVDGWVLAK